MKIVLTVKFGYPITIASQTLSFAHTEHNKVEMVWDKGLLTVTSKSNSKQQVIVPAGNIAYMTFSEESET